MGGSMSIHVKVGDPLPIAAFIEDGVAGKYIRATVKDSQGNGITGSPVTLTDLGGGLYADYSFTKKRGIFYAILEVFDDALFTQPNEDIESSVLTFTDPPFNVLFDAPTEIDISEGDAFEIAIDDQDVIDVELECD
jgi:hypothetical protein